MIRHGKHELSGRVTRQPRSNYEASDTTIRWGEPKPRSFDPDLVDVFDLDAELNGDLSVTLTFETGTDRIQHFEVTLHRATLAILLADLVGAE